MVATNDVDAFERACLIGQVNRIVGLDLVTDNYKHLQPLGLGVKFRAHPLGIGIASVQLKKLDALNERRRKHIAAVEEGIKGIRGVRPSEEVRRRGICGGFYGFPHPLPVRRDGRSHSRRVR